MIATDRITNYSQYQSILKADVREGRVDRATAANYCAAIAARCDWFPSRPLNAGDVWCSLESILLAHEDDTRVSMLRIVKDGSRWCVESGWQYRYSDTRYVSPGTDLDAINWHTQAIRYSEDEARAWIAENYREGTYTLQSESYA